MMKEENFTPGQVGTLLEAMDKKIDLLAEAVAPIPERLERIEERLSSVEVEVRSLKDVVVLSVLPRIAKLESKTGF